MTPLVALRILFKNDSLLLALAGLVVGIVVGCGVAGFRWLLDAIWQAGPGLAIDADDEGSSIPMWVWAMPLVGVGVVVLASRIVYGNWRSQVFGVDQVVKASALDGGKLSLRDGVFNAIASAVTIGSGGSLGREGPAIILGAALSAKFSELLALSRDVRRVLFASGAGAAVSASFGAPIAGALFAHEVILGTYTLSALAPVAIASVSAMATVRLLLGPEVGFSVGALTIDVVHMPLFLLLGIICGIIAALYMKGIGAVRKGADRLNIPAVLRPFVAGVAITVAMMQVPLTLGSGAEMMQVIFDGGLDVPSLAALLAIKILLTTVCLGLGCWGGVFTPALAIGVATGMLFGVFFSDWVPGLVASEQQVYALAAMGGVAAAVLGAPVSTTFIVFEMTGNYSATAMTLVTVVVTSLVAKRLVGHNSFFLLRLEQLGLRLSDGRDVGRLSDVTARAIMRPCDDGEVLADRAVTLTPDDTLDQILASLEGHAVDDAPVIADDKVLGVVHRVDAVTVQRDLYRALLWEDGAHAPGSGPQNKRVN